MSQFLKSFLKNESGATAIEYGLIAAGISVVIVVAVGTIGDSVKATFESISAALGMVPSALAGRIVSCRAARR